MERGEADESYWKTDRQTDRETGRAQWLSCFCPSWARFCCGPSCMCVCMLSWFSCVQLFVTPWAAAHQGPLSMGILSRQECWSGLPLPPPGDPPGIEFVSPMAPALQADSLPLSHQRRPPSCIFFNKCPCFPSGNLTVLLAPKVAWVWQLRTETSASGEEWY